MSVRNIYIARNGNRKQMPKKMVVQRFCRKPTSISIDSSGERWITILIFFARPISTPPKTLFPPPPKFFCKCQGVIYWQNLQSSKIINCTLDRSRLKWANTANQYFFLHCWSNILLVFNISTVQQWESINW